LPAPEPSEPSRIPTPLATSGHASAPAAPSVETLRRKLDAAIVAEAWDAVKAIRDRIVEAERAEAKNVVDLVAYKNTRG
jgi:hypothetical protein